MEQHPVPQQISAYHFRLVGDMTIKQFLELLGGVVVAWVIFSLPIPGIIRIPLAIFSAISGVALAFLPLEGRPLDRWFFAFIKAIYSPTNYLWKKEPIILNFFGKLEKPKKQDQNIHEATDRKKLAEYLETLPAQGSQTTLDNRESEFISNVMKMYMEVQPTTKAQIKLKEELIEERLPQIKVRKLKTPPLDPRAILRGEVILPKRTRKPRRVPVPKQKPVDVGKITSPTLAADKTDQKNQNNKVVITDVDPIGSKRVAIPSHRPTSQLSTNTNLPFPTPPTSPNVLMGMVVDNQGNILENAIVTIKDNQGNIARAQKTNKIGQFFIATPLENNTYQIEVEAEDRSFDIINLELKGGNSPPY